ncbi:hypothetical protein B2J93_6163 [Marssonina coronariae]|uniref:Uncharacterized protein n=1 Tax=Diplocarpon coronariae TaxID=2795749 RepID=A0A218ZHX3_9HELO|nr:hypothetical protein B2J93_6163 [Marssonina coronariae]
MQDKAEQGRARQDGKAKDHDIDVDGLWTPNIGWADEGTRGRGDEAAWRRGAAVNNPNDGADEPRSAYFTKQLVLGSIMIQYRIPRLIQPAGRSSASAPEDEYPLCQRHQRLKTFSGTPTLKGKDPLGA